jgi:CII-binding regulator of phage lambda lysogenization HflD
MVLGTMLVGKVYQEVITPLQDKIHCQEQMDYSQHQAEHRWHLTHQAVITTLGTNGTMVVMVVP